MKLNHPPVDTEWRVTKCHRVEHPETFNTDSLSELRSRVRKLAREAPPHPRLQRKIGPLSFRYETDEQDIVTQVTAYFVTHNGARRRFIQLERTIRA